MTTLWLTQDIKTDEGCRLEAYPDPRTHAAPWTIGYGHTGRNVHQGLAWTQPQADLALGLDVQHAVSAVRWAIPCFAQLGDARQDVLVNMCFNMGLERLLGFHRALAATAAGDWQGAHDELLNSDWAREDPGLTKRAHRLAEQMLTGQRVDAASYAWPQAQAA